MTQGEQVGVLWGEMLRKYNIKIHFAHQTFKWNNEAKGNAAVYCVIIGFAGYDTTVKHLYHYDDIKGDPTVLTVKNINPYLVEGNDVIISRRQKPLCAVPEIGIGNQPIDGGNYLFTTEKKELFIIQEPQSKKWFRRWLGSDEFINGYERWCLWLGDCPPGELRQMPEAMKRVQAVRSMRSASSRASTKKLANTPTRFQVENMPKSSYLIVPEVSSERRRYIPIGYESPETLSSNLVKIVPNASLFHFGVLTSEMHMTWVRYVCGRLKSDYRYSKDIVYNNFPWPQSPTDKQVKDVEAAAQKVLDVRASFVGSSLADLYDPLTMPPALVKAHQDLDRAVDQCYRKQAFTNETRRIEYLFELYDQYTAPLVAAAGVGGKKKSKTVKSLV
ncbi:type IIL restriction-modification enzyme MmeI [Rudanella lutea]|uniref:type IIL restriction-modification enzyme MmeI n=1 Tax=Rudanella lutea TaxID=451374 RepID=UPI00316AED12